MKNSKSIVESDLNYICESAGDELNQLSGKKVLLTGGAGFLGYYFVQSLLKWNDISAKRQPIQLYVYDNYIRGLPDWLERLATNPNLILKKHDITEPLPSDIADFQYIIHAASIASPTYYRRFPIQTMDANVNGLRILLEYCLTLRQRGVPIDGFLFFSSSEVYGDPAADVIPTPETYHGNVSFTGPRACYDESKRYGETLCVNFARQFELPIKMARPFNNYGPGLKISDRRVIPDFARDVLAGKDIVLLSDGSPTRTFCYVADAIVGYLKILVKGRCAEAYNIGVESPEISIADLAQTVVDMAKKLFGYQGCVTKLASEEGDYLTDNPNRRCPDISKARSQLGYRPGIDLEEGIERSLSWYADHRSSEDA